MRLVVYWAMVSLPPTEATTVQGLAEIQPRYQKLVEEEEVEEGLANVDLVPVRYEHTASQVVIVPLYSTHLEPRHLKPRHLESNATRLTF